MNQIFNVSIPYLNANDYEVSINNWFVKNGELINKGTILCEVESTKTVMEIESEESGYIRILKQKNEIVTVGEVIATISLEINETQPSQINSTDSLITQDAMSLIKEYGLDKAFFENQGLVNSKVIYKYLGKNSSLNTTSSLKSLKNMLKDYLVNFPDTIFLFGDFYLVKMAQEILPKEKVNFYLTDDLEYNTLDLTVVPFELLNYIIEIGGKNFFGNFINVKKNEIIKELNRKDIKLINVIHESSRVSDSATLGEGNFIGAFCYVGPDVKIGNSNVILPFTSIAHDSKIGTQTFIADGCRIAGNVEIKDYVSLGLSVNVNKKIIIYEHAQVVSGKTIIDHIKPKSIIK